MFKERYSYEIPKFLKLIGLERTDKNFLGFKWGYISFGLSIAFSVEFPSTWHEERKGRICIGLGPIEFNFNFPWYKAYEDHYQCSGPRFGFHISDIPVMENHFNPILFVYWGNDDGTPKGKKSKLIYFPTDWGSNVRHEILTEKETHEYTYVLNSGEKQHRKATIYAEEREWRRFWIPNKLVTKCINVDFDNEIGERSGSWKGGCIGCGYEMNPGETPLETLRRMEKERKF